MMKRFEKTFKVIGMLLVAMALLFAGCMADGGGSFSSEGAVPTDSQTGTAIPMTFDPEAMTLTIGDGQGMKQLGTILGNNDALPHDIALVNGFTTGAVCAPYALGDARCWVQLINLDNDNYMANAFIDIVAIDSGAAGAATIDNCDIKGGVDQSGTGMGNPGGSCTIGDVDGSTNKVQICIVEDGNYSGPQPYNINGCPTHQGNPNDSAGHKPFQIIQPGGSKGSEWLFANQGANYGFWAWVTSDYFPYTNIITGPATSADSRFNMAERSTFIVTVNGIRDDITAVNENWYRQGVYQRSRTLSGWNATGSNVLAPDPNDQKYFAVNVGLDYPNRIESYKMADPINGDASYEYYTQFSYLLRYDPGVVLPKATNSKSIGNTLARTGLQQHCSGAARCGVGKESFTGYAAPSSGAFGGYGIIGTFIAMSNAGQGESFTMWSTSTSYLSLNGAAVFVTFFAPVFGNAGAHGVARMNMALSSCKVGYTNCVLQDGPDVAPEMELSLIYFKLLSAANGTGSEFWIDTYSGYTSFTMGYTNGTLTPSGAGAGGTDDLFGYCYDPSGAGIPEQPCTSADAASRIITNGAERTNPKILQEGKFGNAFNPANPGAWQQWPASIVVQ